MALRRRSAKEWARLLDELERSGQTTAAFARARGIRVDTLKWWRWRLQREAKRGAAKPQIARVKLLAVEPARDVVAAPDSDERAPAWELVAPTGHVLRVYDRGGLSVLRVALTAVARARRR
jgi:hypothetical protein